MKIFLFTLILLLTTSPVVFSQQESAHQLVEFHMAQMKKLVAAGPFGDDGRLRGFFVFRVASLDEAKALTASDPAVQAGPHDLGNTFQSSRSCARRGDRLWVKDTNDLQAKFSATSHHLLSIENSICRLFRGDNWIDFEFDYVAPISDPLVEMRDIVCFH